MLFTLSGFRCSPRPSTRIWNLDSRGARAFNSLLALGTPVFFLSVVLFIASIRYERSPKGSLWINGGNSDKCVKHLAWSSGPVRREFKRLVVSRSRSRRCLNSGSPWKISVFQRGPQVVALLAVGLSNASLTSHTLKRLGWRRQTHSDSVLERAPANAEGW